MPKIEPPLGGWRCWICTYFEIKDSYGLPPRGNYRSICSSGQRNYPQALEKTCHYGKLDHERYLQTQEGSVKQSQTISIRADTDSNLDQPTLENLRVCLRNSNAQGMVMVSKTGLHACQIQELIDLGLLVRRRYLNNPERTFIPRVAKMRKKYLND